MLTKIGYWLPIAVTATLICFLVYGIGQQILRQSANDPQIQLSEDIANSLSRNVPVSMFMPQAQVDISKSLTPFMIVFDANGEASTSSATLNNQTPTPPPGVLLYARDHGQNRLTWQPEPGVRIASVVTYFKGSKEGYVLVGKSLREVEKRNFMLLQRTAIAWVVILIASFIATLIFVKNPKS